jgi:hypothetical protein
MKSPKATAAHPLGAADGSTLSEVEAALMRAMRRNQDLREQYRGQQPADKNLTDEIEWALDAFMRRDTDRMARLTDRMNDNLPPMESNRQAHARRSIGGKICGQ